MSRGVQKVVGTKAEKTRVAETKRKREKERRRKEMRRERMLKTLFSLYLHNQQINFHKTSCTEKPQIMTICIYVKYTKVTTDY